jgi:CheY-like chemotaxis protein
LRLGKSGAFFSEKTVLGVAAELAVLREFYRNAFAQAGIAVSVSCPDDLRTLMNRKSFSRICSNYLENALRHAEPGSSVWVEALELSHDEIIVRVENDGPLIHTDNPERLFKPFVSLRPEKGGAGLGLAIVARLARHSGGRAGYSHRLARNSFYVILPQPHPDATAPAGALHPAPGGAEAKAETGAAETDAASGDSNLLILVVEDSREIRAMFVEMLHPKYLVKLASDGREALNLLSAGLKPDLILSDIMMADLDGFALLSALDRAAAPDEAAAEPPVPFLFVTAMTSAAEKMPATRRPVRICTKPFTEEQIMRHIRELVKEEVI